ncbi:phosphate regulon sensor histidine kinase PhoR [Methylobacillus flagellatus]|uniref:phosphate regulon sensor histidine kinase PhoR n=1 Tax=Methylobacillus flagellatus TaxID=405 RepID=UPI0010F4C884|nr:phosphate regulon sensor histidine kinase PhoR [Methylobacillus flagellatus]
MQDIRWRAFWLLLTWLFFCLILGLATSTEVASLVFSAGLLLYYFNHLFWLQQLLDWFRKPELSTMPIGKGLWEDVFSAVYQHQRRHSRSQTQLSSALDRFRHAASALPDGVVLLNGQDQIEWCNPPAEHLLGLSLPQDTGQPIGYLVRHTDFIEYMHSGDYEDAIKLKSWRMADVMLEIKLVSFGSNQKLLICRDISQVEKLDAMRRDFIANVSHELRTPLTVVGGFLETLQDIDGAVPPSTKSYFNMMQEQTSRMRRLIEDLLMLSQLENSSILPQDSEVDVPKLLDLVMKEAHSLSNGRHHIKLESDNSIWMLGAQEELHSAFGNLVSNAVRYTPEGGTITLQWQARGLEAAFSVTDTGIGIEHKHIARITERFYRVDRSRSRETGGTGLGLSIVKHILTRHQGRLEIDSELGVGSTFRMVFAKNRVLRKS